MTAMRVEIVKVVFVSAWSEGEVRTSASLDVQTGEVFDIEVSECGAEFEHLIEEYIETVTCVAKASVVLQPGDGSYRMARLEDMDAFRRAGAVCPESSAAR